MLPAPDKITAITPPIWFESTLSPQIICDALRIILRYGKYRIDDGPESTPAPSVRKWPVGVYAWIEPHGITKYTLHVDPQIIQADVLTAFTLRQSVQLLRRLELFITKITSEITYPTNFIVLRDL